MTCLSLLASPKFTQKRLAYLGICVLLDEKSEVLLLTSHTIKKDLENTNQFIISAALNAIGEISTPDMCRDTCPEVIKCLSSTNPYIKKKACLALSKIIRSCPELVDTVGKNLKMVFDDKNHGVLLSGLSLVIEIFKQKSFYIKKYIKYVPNMIKYLKNLSATNYSPEYDINGITDPFLQAKILEVLAYFGRVFEDENEEMTNLLGSLPTNTDTSTKNTGNAVLYELVRTIFAYDSSQGLKTLGSSILGKFLANKDNNYKYIAMNSLEDIARIDLSIVQKHKNTILEFLNDNDVAIKRKSLDLTYLIVNETNIKQIIRESLNFLSMSENDQFKEELTRKIFESLEKYSPSSKWEIDTLLKMLCISEHHISDDIICKIINLVLNTNELHQYSMFRFFIAMKANMNQEGLMRVGIYLLGELCSLIINVSTQGEDNENILITEKEIVDLIDELVHSRETSEVLHEELMNCCFKIINKLTQENAIKIKEMIEQETRSFFCEVQQRANEYLVFTQIANSEMQRKITENIPLNKNISDEQTKKEVIVDDFENETEKGLYQNLIQGGASLPKQQVAIPSKEEQKQPQQNQTGVNLLDDIGEIFNSPTNPISTNITNTQPQTQPQNSNMFDIFNMIPTTNSQNSNEQQSQNMQNTQNIQNNPVQQNQPQQPAIDLLSQLGNIYINPQQTFPQMININQTQNHPMENLNSIITQQQQQSSNAMKEVFKNNDLSIYSMLNQTGASYAGAFYISNNSNNLLSNVKLNFLVKKHITFKVNSTSGNTLDPNASLGIKKDITMQNNDITKPIVIKLNLSYSTQGRDVTESPIINI